MRNKVAKSILVVALIVLVGGHWCLLQSLAWVGMFARFSQSAPISVALTKTFDGKHPCTLCRVVREAKKSQQPWDSLKVEIKTDLFLAEGQLIKTSPNLSHLARWPLFSESAVGRTERPPVPPPRQA